MPKLFMLLIGCTPPGRHIEQHDVYFGIGEKVADLVAGIIKFWPEADGKIHVDAWREVTMVNGHAVSIVAAAQNQDSGDARLFFINLGGYKENEFEEFHYKMIIAATNKGEAIDQSKKTAFFQHTGFEGASSHVDNKFGIDVDDIFEIADILPQELKRCYHIHVTPLADSSYEDELRLGYFKLNSFA